MKGNRRSLDDILDLCECEVSLEVDEYTSNYWTLEEGLVKIKEDWDVSEDILEEMRLIGHIVSLQCYPRTPVGLELVFGGTVQSVIDRMYVLLTGDT